jgi:hypothetical protein
MLKLPLLEFFFRGLPEEFLIVFAIFAFSKTAINIRKYIITSVSFVILVYAIRFLPIQYGVHTILGLIVGIVLTVTINKIDIIKAIQASIMTIILEFICEGINVFIIENIFKADVKYVLNEPWLKILYGIPSLLIFAGVVSIYYFSLSSRKKLREVSNGEIS